MEINEEFFYGRVREIEEEVCDTRYFIKEGETISLERNNSTKAKIFITPSLG